MHNQMSLESKHTPLEQNNLEVENDRVLNFERISGGVASFSQTQTHVQLMGNSFPNV